MASAVQNSSKEWPLLPSEGRSAGVPMRFDGSEAGSAGPWGGGRRGTHGESEYMPFSSQGGDDQQRSVKSGQRGGNSEARERCERSRAFFALYPDGWFRAACIDLACDKRFDYAILGCIVVNAIIISLDDPVTGFDSSAWYVITESLDSLFLGLFTFEMLVKLVAQGGFLHSTGYFREAWNWLDCVVVLSGLTALFLTDSSSFTILRVVRIFRPLRTISRVRGMRNLVDTLGASLPILLNVLLLSLFVFFVFGLVGVILWSGTLHKRCYGYSYDEGNYTYTTVCGEESKVGFFRSQCAEGFACVTGAPNPNRWANWDHIGASFLIVLQCLTLDDWNSHMYQVQDGWSPFAAIYFLVLTLLGAYFVLNLVLAVVTDSFTRFAIEEDDRELTGARDEMRDRLRREREANENEQASYRGWGEVFSDCGFSVDEGIQRSHSLGRDDSDALSFAGDDFGSGVGSGVGVSSGGGGTGDDGYGDDDRLAATSNARSRIRSHSMYMDAHNLPGTEQGAQMLLKDELINREWRKFTGGLNRAGRTAMKNMRKIEGEREWGNVVRTAGGAGVGGVAGQRRPAGTARPGAGQEAGHGEHRKLQIEAIESSPCLSKLDTEARKALMDFTDSAYGIPAPGQQRKPSAGHAVDPGVSRTSMASKGESCNESYSTSRTMLREVPSQLTTDPAPCLQLQLPPSAIHVSSDDGGAGGASSPRRAAMIVDTPVVIATDDESARDGYKFQSGRNSVWSVLQNFGNDIIEHPLFYNLMSVLIIVNALLMSIEHYGMNKAMVDTLEALNVVFVACFAFETTMKLFVMRWKVYFADRFNVLDLLIVIISIVEILFLSSASFSIFRIFRLVRVIRIIKIARRWRILRHIVKTVGSSLSYMGYLLLLLMLFIYVFAILGRQLFAGKITRCCTAEEHERHIFKCYGRTDENYIYDSCWNTAWKRSHFDDLYWAMISVFQVVTEDYWSAFMYKAMDDVGVGAGLYFIVVVMLGRYMLLNLFVAILLVGLEREHLRRDDGESSIAESVCLDDIDSLTNSASEEEPEYPPQLQYERKEKEKKLQEANKTAMRREYEEGMSPVYTEGTNRSFAKQSPSPTGMLGASGPKPVSPNVLHPLLRGRGSDAGGSPEFPLSARLLESTPVNGGPGDLALALPPNTMQSPRPLSPGGSDEYRWGGGYDRERDDDACPSPLAYGDDKKLSKKKSFSRHRSQSLFRALQKAEAEDALSEAREETESGTSDEGSLGIVSGHALDHRDRRNSEAATLGGLGGGAVVDNPPALRLGSVTLPPLNLRGALSRTSVGCASNTPRGPPSSEGDIYSPRQPHAQALTSTALAGVVGSGAPRAVGQLLTGPPSAADAGALGGDEAAAAAAAAQNPSAIGNAMRNANKRFTADGRRIQFKRDRFELSDFQAIAVDSKGNEEEVLLGKSWGCLGTDNPFRVWCFNVVNGTHFPFERAIGWLIFLSCFAMVFNKQLLGNNKAAVTALEVLDIIFTVIFFLEILLRITVYTFRSREAGKSAYIRRAKWNWLDMIIVGVSVAMLPVQLLMQDSGHAFSGVSSVLYKTARAMRAGRPVRILVRSHNMKIVISALVRTVPAVFNVFAVASVSYFMFGVASVQLFKGAFMACNDGSNATITECLNTTYFTPPPIEPFVSMVPDKMLYDMATNTSAILIRRRWQNMYAFSFNNIGRSLLTLLECAILNGWTEVLFAVVDCTNNPDGPTLRDNQEYMGLLVVLWVFFGGLGIMNIFVGCVVDYFSRLKTRLDRSALLTDNQMQALRIKKILVHQRAKHRLAPSSTSTASRISKVCFQIVHHKAFQIPVILSIVANVVVMTTIHYDQTEQWTKMQSALNLVFSILFTVEMILKLGVGGQRVYFATAWNRIDFFIVLSSWTELVITLFITHGNQASVVQLVRLGRILRLIRHFKGLKKLLLTLYYSIPALVNVGSLLFLVFFMYGVMGMAFFEGVRKVPRNLNFLNDNFNFDTFPISVLTLYRVATFDNWRVVMAACRISEPYCTLDIDGKGGTDCGATSSFQFLLVSAYFALFVVTVGFVMLNLFIAVVLENFRESVLLPPPLQAKMDLVKMFRDEWAHYDPTALQIIKAYNFVPMMLRLPPPLGFADCDSSEILPSLLHLDFPVTKDMDILFGDVIDAIGETVFKIKLVDREAAKSHLSRERDIKKDKERYALGFTIGDYYAASVIQVAWKRWHGSMRSKKRRPWLLTGNIMVDQYERSHKKNPRLGENARNSAAPRMPSTAGAPSFRRKQINKQKRLRDTRASACWDESDEEPTVHERRPSMLSKKSSMFVSSFRFARGGGGGGASLNSPSSLGPGGLHNTLLRRKNSTASLGKSSLLSGFGSTVGGGARGRRGLRGGRESADTEQTLGKRASRDANHYFTHRADKVDMLLIMFKQYVLRLVDDIKRRRREQGLPPLGASPGSAAARALAAGAGGNRSAATAAVVENNRLLSPRTEGDESIENFRNSSKAIHSYEARQAAGSGDLTRVLLDVAGGTGNSAGDDAGGDDFGFMMESVGVAADTPSHPAVYARAAAAAAPRGGVSSPTVSLPVPTSALLKPQPTTPVGVLMQSEPPALAQRRRKLSERRSELGDSQFSQLSRVDDDDGDEEFEKGIATKFLIADNVTKLLVSKQRVNSLLPASDTSRNSLLSSSRAATEAVEALPATRVDSLPTFNITSASESSGFVRVMQQQRQEEEEEERQRQQPQLQEPPPPPQHPGRQSIPDSEHRVATRPAALLVAATRLPASGGLVASPTARRSPSTSPREAAAAAAAAASGSTERRRVSEVVVPAAGTLARDSEVSAFAAAAPGSMSPGSLSVSRMTELGASLLMGGGARSMLGASLPPESAALHRLPSGSAAVQRQALSLATRPPSAQTVQSEAEGGDASVSEAEWPASPASLASPTVASPATRAQAQAGGTLPLLAALQQRSAPHKKAAAAARLSLKPLLGGSGGGGRGDATQANAASPVTSVASQPQLNPLQPPAAAAAAPAMAGLRQEQPQLLQHHQQEQLQHLLKAKQQLALQQMQQQQQVPSLALGRPLGGALSPASVPTSLSAAGSPRPQWATPRSFSDSASPPMSARQSVAASPTQQSAAMAAMPGSAALLSSILNPAAAAAAAAAAAQVGSTPLHRQRFAARGPTVQQVGSSSQASPMSSEAASPAGRRVNLGQRTGGSSLL